MTLADEVKSYVEKAVADLRGEDDYMPFMLIRDQNDDTAFIGLAMMGDEDQKDQLADVMMALVAAHNAKEVAFSSCAWTVAPMSKEEYEKGHLPPSQHPDRIEQSFVMHASPEGDAMHFAAITRGKTKGSKVKLAPWDETIKPDPNVKMGGRFGDAIHLGLWLGSKLPPEAREYVKRNFEKGNTKDVIEPIIRAMARVRNTLEEQEREANAGGQGTAGGAEARSGGNTEGDGQPPG